MKKKIRKTGEIVDVISYTAPFGTQRDDTRDFVDYIDSKGKERTRVPMNIYWDFEDMEEELTKEIDWEQRRYEIAKGMMAAFLSNSCSNIHLGNPVDQARYAVMFANALIEELLKGGKQ